MPYPILFLNCHGLCTYCLVHVSRPALACVPQSHIQISVCARIVTALFISFRLKKGPLFVAGKFIQRNIIRCANIVCGL